MRASQLTLTLKTAVQPKETKEGKEFEGFTQTRPLTCRVNGGCLRASFLSLFCVLFGHPTAGLSLNDFALKHPDSRPSLVRWYRLMKTGRFRSFSELKHIFASADKVDKFTVFNIGGNKARLIAAVHYNRGKVYIRHVLTHHEYDLEKWKAQEC